MSTAAAPRPRRSTKCPECAGTGREIVTEEVMDAEGMEVIGETTSDFGPCEICDGRGWFAPETAAQKRERLAAELEARRVFVAEREATHLARNDCGRACPPWCPEVRARIAARAAG